jgi:hypothetical protein
MARARLPGLELSGRSWQLVSRFERIPIVPDEAMEMRAV